ncbi:A-kinase-interacting protein 1 [Conger conger]|uniref:A-kinase-interacting protein 1 n=1 Tax=Conger conger TaxID=82655 RepID=UPI002A5AF18D|nr:A-kinase-interacting protein 1 [Conger conger]XP_061078698.1 A-kinase-interacting protein 1 [Conger conger]XP_061078699.1 A-kinase-interacting protein 1 [Conger conger]
MSSQAWLESSLRRSSRLGLQVLERAQRRSVDWASLSPSSQPTPLEDAARNQPQYCEAETQNVRARTKLDDAFETIVEFMAETTHQCKHFYKSVPAQGASENEVKHVCRYHSRQLPGHLKDTTSGKNEQESLEDLHIEVSPGTYAVTVGAGDSSQQTHLVRVDAGESVNVTFHL